jgi:uncharacterized damage-inducible protein DinB
MPLPAPARDYLLKALEGNPVVFARLVGAYGEDDSLWDRRPDPERFTLREILAHLADWEPIWLERVQRIAQGNHPFLPSVDEGLLAVRNDYPKSSPTKNLRRQRDGRMELVAYLSTLPDDAWDLTGDREFVGILTLQQQAYYVLAHDAYHMRQVAEWLGS